MRLPFIPAYQEKKPDKVKWPTSKFAESGTEAADSIAKSRNKKRRKKSY